jgi:hypothetical protein
LVTACVPVIVAPPPRLSMMTRWPRMLLRDSAISRAVTSTPPPAAKVTIRVTGLPG